MKIALHFLIANTLHTSVIAEDGPSVTAAATQGENDKIVLVKFDEWQALQVIVWASIILSINNSELGLILPRITVIIY